MSAMTREDKKRTRSRDQLVDKNELIAIAREEECFQLGFEAEMRAAGHVPDPRPIEVPDASHPPEAL